MSEINQRWGKGCPICGPGAAVLRISDDLCGGRYTCMKCKLTEWEDAEENKATLRTKGPSFIDRILDPLILLACGMIGPLIFLACVLLATLICVASVRAVEIPDGIIKGIVKVESGADWRNIDDIIGGWKPGKAGEISHFQLTPIALRELRVEHKAGRIAASPLLAESYARAYLVLCYKKRGNWRDAVAAYNAGSRYRSDAAREYARKVFEIAGL